MSRYAVRSEPPLDDSARFRNEPDPDALALPAEVVAACAESKRALTKVAEALDRAGLDELAAVVREQVEMMFEGDMISGLQEMHEERVVAASQHPWRDAE